MRRRSVVFVLVGTAFFGLALLSVIQRFPREPCGGGDCFRLFGLLLEMTATILASLCLAAGTFDWVADRRQAVRLAWYPGWGVLCGGVVGTYVAVFGPFAAGLYWNPVIVGGTAGVIREVWSW